MKRSTMRFSALGLGYLLIFETIQANQFNWYSPKVLVTVAFIIGFAMLVLSLWIFLVDPKGKPEFTLLSNPNVYETSKRKVYARTMTG